MNQQDKDRLRELAETAKTLDMGVDAALVLSLLEENEALAKKAKRYDWLRDVAHPDSEASGISVSEVDFNDWGNRFTRYFHGSELDAAIDAAMQPKGE